MDKANIQRIIEAALFVSGRWLSLEELARIAGTGSIGLVKESLAEIKERYIKSGSAITLLEHNANYKLDIIQEIADKVYYLAPEPELSPALITTLAYIVKNQPVKQSRIVEVIGNRTYDYIRELKKKGFIEAKKQGHTKIVTTTARFRKYFGIKDQFPTTPQTKESLGKWVE
jgi:segregation and condensation protein B